MRYKTPVYLLQSDAPTPPTGWMWRYLWRHKFARHDISYRYGILMPSRQAWCRECDVIWEAVYV